VEIRTARDSSGIHDGEAIHWCRKVAETGDIEAITRLGTMLSWAGDATAEAEGRQWLDFAIAAGHVPAMYELAGALRRRRDAAAEVWYLRAAGTGHVAAMEYLAQIYADSGRISEAETWYRRAVAAGNPDSAMSLIVLLAQNGKDSEIAGWMDWAHQHVADKDILRYSYLLSREGTNDLADRWLAHYAALGNGEAMLRLAENYSRRDRAVETEHWYRKAIEAGAHGAAGQFAYWLDQQGRAADAEQWRAMEDRSWMDEEQARSITDIVTIGITIITTSTVVPFISAIAQEAGKNTYERVKKHFARTKDTDVAEALDDSKVIKIIVRDPQLPIEVEIRRDLPAVAIDGLQQITVDDEPSRYVWNPIRQSWQAEEP
jgi:TPR repeat protein